MTKMGSGLGKKWNTVAIVGVGLIGGSIGLALRKRRLCNRVVGVGRRAPSLQKAKRRGAVHETTTVLARGVADADLVIICTPVSSIAHHAAMAAAACPEHCLITDAGSTKAQIVAEIEARLERQIPFIGSHPLAGGEKTGPAFARENLFQDRVVVITPTRRCREPDVQTITDFWTDLGAEVVSMTPEAHDAAVAATSHLPHLTASLLAASTPKQYLSLVATGWLDTTRVAAGDVQLWTQILSDNRENVLKCLDKFAGRIATARQALEDGDKAKIAGILKSGRDRRDSVGN